MRGSLKKKPQFPPPPPITIYRVVRKRSCYGVKELVLVGPCKELDNTLVHTAHCNPNGSPNELNPTQMVPPWPQHWHY